MELYISEDPITCYDSHWYKEFMRDKEEEGIKAEMKEWIDLDTFVEWLSQKEIEIVYLEYYFFHHNVDFYKFLCICDENGVKKVIIDSNDFIIKDFAYAISLVCLMS